MFNLIFFLFFGNFLAKFKTDKQLEKKCRNVDLIADNASVFFLKQPRKHEDYLIYRKVSSDIEFERDNYILYPYQNELVSRARDGRNTIICAPTGSGKTIVATDIVLNHIKTFKLKGKIARVC